ncbi:MAG: glutamine-hydrolyzing GMP synthase [Candidatus Pacebacteria bacterium]|nr:glutamine-hydrolyzing GMP synthase [Candidatus Paceibacterota bacterium]
MILILDFGSQTTHLIGRRLKDLGVASLIVSPKAALTAIKKHQPAGLILSGGPASVYEQAAPTIDRKIFKLGLPILGICYGWQLMAQLLGGKVVAGKKEYGPAKLTVNDFQDLFYGWPEESTVWESHGDSVVQLPPGFEMLATTPGLANSAVRQAKKQFFAVQFHPEASHTQHGKLLLENFASRICQLALKPQKLDVKAIITAIQEKVGDQLVIGAVSGGTDSTVAAALVAKAVGKQFYPVYIDSGLMRETTLIRIKQDLPKIFGTKIKVVKARKKFLQSLKGVVDPELKRKVIGKLYIDLFEAQLDKLSKRKIKFLMQGTTYADFIHSQGNKRSALIKSHHNVGGLPAKMKLRLLEPLRYFYTDQVRELGLALGLPKEAVFQSPFPGPGHAIRILGEVTAQKLKRQRLADQIVVEEIHRSNWHKQLFQYWAVLTNAQSTAIKGDGRFFGDVVAIRLVQSQDRMTADWAKLPYELLSRLSSRIVNEVPGVSRVVYDITPKPPATMEWE